MDFVLLVLVFLTAVSAQQQHSLWHGEENQDGHISRPNIGVHYRKIGQIVDGHQPWLHSFVFKLPKFDSIFEGFPYDRYPKEGADKIRKQHMDIHQMSKDLHKHAKVTVDALPSSTTKLVHRRGKHAGVLPFIGSVSKTLFGTATFEDVQKVARKVNKIIAQEKKLDDGVLAIMDDLQSYMTLNDDRTDQIAAMVKANNDELKAVELKVSSLRKVAIWARESAVNFTMDYVSQMMAATSIKRRLVELRMGIDMIATSTLPTEFVSLEDIQTVLDSMDTLRSMQRHFTRHYDFIVKDPRYYLHKSSFLAHMAGDSLWITLKMPVGSDAPYDLYRLTSWGVPASVSSDFDTYVTGLPQYLALNRDRDTMLQLTADDMHYCEGKHVRACHTLHERMPVPDSANSCTTAVIRNDEDRIHRHCQFVVRKQEESESRILDLSADYVAIRRAGSSDINIRCGSMPKRYLPPCTSCVVKLPCSCRIGTDSGNWHYSSLLGNCSTDKEVSVTMGHTVNFAVLKSLLPPNRTVNITADQLLDKPFAEAAEQLQTLEATFKRHWHDQHQYGINLDTLVQDEQSQRKTLASFAAMIDYQQTILNLVGPNTGGIVLLLVLQIVIAVIGVRCYSSLRREITALERAQSHRHSCGQCEFTHKNFSA